MKDEEEKIEVAHPQRKRHLGQLMRRLFCFEFCQCIILKAIVRSQTIFSLSNKLKFQS